MPTKEDLLDLIGNETRRNILALLSESPHYILQISGKLNVTQPAILKHLAILENAGLVESTMKENNRGAPRKYYKICSSVNIEIVLGPKEFRVDNLSSTENCPVYLQGVDRMQQLTKAINEAKTIKEKSCHAQELINEANKLLSCKDFNKNNPYCNECNKIAMLKKGASDIILSINQSMAKGDVNSILQALTSVINLS